MKDHSHVLSGQKLPAGEEPRHRLCEPPSHVPSYFLGCGSGPCCLAVTGVVGGGWLECDFNRQ